MVESNPILYKPGKKPDHTVVLLNTVMLVNTIKNILQLLNKNNILNT